MSTPRNGNRKCKTCKHYLCAHGFGPQGYTGCIVTGCSCPAGTVKKREGGGILYSDDSGYIRGQQHADHFWCSEFVVDVPHRKTGAARRLAQHLPQRCRLEARPLHKMGPGLELMDLIGFYESLGFVSTIDPKLNNCSIMVRE